MGKLPILKHFDVYSFTFKGFVGIGLINLPYYIYNWIGEQRKYILFVSFKVERVFSHSTSAPNLIREIMYSIYCINVY